MSHAPHLAEKLLFGDFSGTDHQSTPVARSSTKKVTTTTRKFLKLYMAPLLVSASKGLANNLITTTNKQV